MKRRDTRNWRAALAVLSLSATACTDPQPPKVTPTPPEVAKPPVVATTTQPPPKSQPPTVPTGDPDAPGKREVRAAVAAEAAPAASQRLSDAPKADELKKKVSSYFGGLNSSRIYIQVDKPIYKPGETIWVKSWDLSPQALSGHTRAASFQYQLISPKGAIVLQKRVRAEAGTASNDFEVPADVQGGEYTLRVIAQDGVQADRPVILSTYEAPRVKLKLEFVRKAYGEGDEVTATIEVKRATGETLPNHELIGAVRLDGADLPRVKLTTNSEGNGLVRFTLPASIQTGDGLLTVMIEDGGITESISKRIPILVRKLQFSAFPEGGKLVQGQASRLYFEAKTPLGKPADVEGKIVDDVGNAVAAFQTYRDGLGRVEFTPATGRTYHAEISKPAGVAEHYALPLAQEEGCVLRSFDDLDGQLPALRVQVRCTENKKIVVAATLRENVLDVAAVEVKAGEPATVYLEPKEAALAHALGVARVTVFDEQLNPLAERIVFRNRRSRLNVKVTPDKARYAPRDNVALSVVTTDLDGQPVPAELALSVVDDTVVSFADDKTGHLLSKLLLEPELPGKIEEPNFYFDLTEEKSALGLDLLMGTRGYRTFEWRPVLDPAPVSIASLATGGAQGFGHGRGVAADELDDVVQEKAGGAKPMARPMAPPRPMAPAPMQAPPPPPAVAVAAATPPMQPMQPVQPMAKPDMARGPRPAMDPAPRAEPMRERVQVAKKEVAAHEMKQMAALDGIAGDDANALQGAAGVGRGGRGGLLNGDVPLDNKPMEQNMLAGKADKDWAGAKNRQAEVAWAPVRVFPQPVYAADFSGPRTDFRETIAWSPRVVTDKSGHGTVTFAVSDAITSFRVFTEGFGAGLAGRDETVITSSLPFSMGIKLPAEVSAGDVINLPLTLSNERDRELDVTLKSDFGALLTLQGDPAKGGALAAQARRSLFYPLSVTGKEGDSEVHFTARTGSLSDEFIRKVHVTRLGFPQQLSRSGKASGTVKEEIDLGEAIEGSADATIKLYPSPVATMVSGLEGMLREPTGCFEQTSSTNYPNVMVMGYLRSHDVADPALLEKSGRLIDSGYKRLTGYESPNKGYEWFGGDPGHEALTAYGLLEFMDMKRVYGNVDDAMLDRTVRWLKSRRDGKGGYLRDPKALDSFGAAAPAVTNAYITYSLVRAGQTDLGPEIEASAALARDTQDAYLLALAANTLLRVPAQRSAGIAAAKKLAGLQESDGAWKKAEQSITRSGGSNLYVETTSLAVMALLEAGGHDGELRKAIEWMQANRSGFGQWGATQATVLALQAMTAYDEASRKAPTSGTVSLSINGQPAGELSYEAGRRDPLVFTGIGSRLKSGKNTIELTQKGGEGLPYSMAFEFRSAKPASSDKSQVNLETALDRNQMKMGESIRLNATVTNKTAAGLPMTMARVGLPGGLQFQNWQLKELREKGLIAFYETRPREVILYFRDMKPSEVKKVPIDLIASVPGHYTGPASSAYLYYNDQFKTWTDALAVQVDP